MKKHNFWRCLTTATLTLGLLSCVANDDPGLPSASGSYNQVSADNSVPVNEPQTSSKKIVQPSTPGPKQTQAPQLPVLE